MTLIKSTLLVTLPLIFCMTSIPHGVEAFGARRQYHSYHHFQAKNGKNSLRQSDRRASASIQDETEMLLERAEKIRDISRRMQEVQLSSKPVLTEEEEDSRGGNEIFMTGLTV